MATTNTGNAVDIGFYGKYVSSGTKYTGLLWDANVAKYRLFHGNATEPTTTVDIAGTGHSTSTLLANLEGNVTGNAATATALETARNIGGVSFNGTANINLPGVNATGNQDTSGNAATATVLETARTIGGVSFNGSANINLPGVNTAGNQNTSGTAATVTGAAQTAITSLGTLTDLTVSGTSTTIGTVTSGIWQGTAIASAYLDADTALSLIHI